MEKTISEGRPECILLKMTTYRVSPGNVVALKCPIHPDGHRIDHIGVVPWPTSSS